MSTGHFSETDKVTVLAVARAQPTHLAPLTRSGKLQVKDIISEAQLVVHLQGDVALLLDPHVVDKRLRKEKGSNGKTENADTAQGSCLKSPLCVFLLVSIKH